VYYVCNRDIHIPFMIKKIYIIDILKINFHNSILCTKQSEYTNKTNLVFFLSNFFSSFFSTSPFFPTIHVNPTPHFFFFFLPTTHVPPTFLFSSPSPHTYIPPHPSHFFLLFPPHNSHLSPIS
jgi:hypothetical protein